ncbi:hypothetical protein G7046_g5186 [Stylonectria norvegica]|nr:hypothetical protein G7046_g5186 [Stylonectria norvegica]
MKFSSRFNRNPKAPKEPKEPVPGRYRPVHRKWPHVSKMATWWLMLPELAGVVPCLVIFGLSQPDLYRTALWQIGWDQRLNSNPAMILYAYANHRPLPTIPFIWTKTLTDFNVAIAVISLFMLLSKLIAFIMKVWFPIAATFINIGMVTIYAVSVYGQIGPDYADKRYPAHAAWYFRYGCDMAKPYGQYSNCQLAQSSLGVTFFMMTLYLLNLGFSAYAMWPNKIQDIPDSDDDDDYSPASEPKERQNWEMHSMKSPMSARAMPYTPRTQAFHTLDRQLPLRSQQQVRYGYQ